MLNREKEDVYYTHIYPSRYVYSFDTFEADNGLNLHISKHTNTFYVIAGASCVASLCCLGSGIVVLLGPENVRKGCEESLLFIFFFLLSTHEPNQCSA